jgi:DNA polymerase/3'-5' exonuclease PolX
MARTKRKTEEFEVKKDYIPDFLEALGELADLCAKEKDFRATSFRKAIVALEGQIITAVEDIKLFKLAELKGVGKSTLEMLTEFIETGKIERLEELRPEEEEVLVDAESLMSMFGHMTEHECSAMYEHWAECGQGSYDPDDEMY